MLHAGGGAQAKLTRENQLHCTWYDANGHPLTSTAVRLCWLLLEANATTYLTGPNWAKYAPNLKEVLNNHGIELEEVK